MKLFIMACGGSADITAKVFKSYEEAYNAMKAAYEDIMEGWALEPDEEGCILDSHHAMIYPEDLEEPEGAWGATIIEQEIEFSETAVSTAFIYNLLRETKYGTDSLCIISAKNREEAVKHAQIMALDALESAYDNNPDEEWGNDVGLCRNDSDETIACGIDPDNIDGYIADETYLILLETGGVALKSDPPLTDDESGLLEIAYELDDTDYFEEGLKEAFRMKASGKSIEEIKAAIEKQI